MNAMACLSWVKDTARDVVSRWDVIEVHTRSTSALAAQFIASMRRRFPFPLKALQVDRLLGPVEK